MLTRADYGLSIAGRVDAVSDLEHRQGVSKNKDKNGQIIEKPYSFYQQKVCLAAAGAMYEIAFTSKEDPKGPLATFELDQVVRIRVGPPKVFNNEVSFEAILP